MDSTTKQVFVAYSYKLYPKPDYRKGFKELEDKYDVTFIFADEKITNMHIMKKIESYIRNSDFSIFDISGWNPNVALELGFAMATGDNWYISIDPNKTDIKDVPSDLRGIDRIQYESYTEYKEKLTVLMDQHYSMKRTQGINDYIKTQTDVLHKLIKDHPGLTVTSMSQMTGIDVTIVQIALKPLIEDAELVTSGQRRGTKYYLYGEMSDENK